MSPAPAIPDFAGKLALVLERLACSLDGLAMMAGVDGALAQRWATGEESPGEAEFAAFAAAIRPALPGIALADWLLPHAGFAARLAAIPTAGPLAALLPRFAAALAEQLDAAAARYAGLWLLLQADARRQDGLGVRGCVAEVERRDDLLWMRAGSGLAGSGRAAGPLLPQQRLLYAALEGQDPGSRLAWCLLQGVAQGRAMLLDGVAGCLAAAPGRPVVATPMIGIRLGDPLADPAPRFAEAQHRVTRLNARGLATRLPAWLLARLEREVTGPPPLPAGVLPAASLACSAEDLAAGTAPPEAAAALAALRALFAEAAGEG
jgi:hypothetical protein